MVEQVKRKPQIRNLKSHRILQDHLLIVPVIFEEEGVVVKPKQYEDKPEYGLVLSVGSGRLLDSGVRVEPDVQVGDFIVYGKYSTVKVTVEGVDFYYIRDEDVMSVYTGS